MFPEVDYSEFPTGFFNRSDQSDDAHFYGVPRLVTHIDDGAITAVAQVYTELGVDGSLGEDRHVLDLMSSWISHFSVSPSQLTVLGMNEAELAVNPAATDRVVRDLNIDPTLPFGDRTFDGVVCCVSVDYLTRPLEVFAEVARVLKPSAPFVCTFSNRCFPTKAIRGWLETNDDGHCSIVAEYFRRTAGFDPPTVVRMPTSADPLFAVWSHKVGR
jgi:SAM-dependent methyltransferase